MVCSEKRFNSYYYFFKQASECLRVSWFLYYLQLFKLNKYSTVLLSGFIKSRRDLISLLAGALLFVLMLQCITPGKSCSCRCSADDHMVGFRSHSDAGSGIAPIDIISADGHSYH